MLLLLTFDVWILKAQQPWFLWFPSSPQTHVPCEIRVIVAIATATCQTVQKKVGQQEPKLQERGKRFIRRYGYFGASWNTLENPSYATHHLQHCFWSDNSTEVFFEKKFWTLHLSDFLFSFFVFTYILNWLLSQDHLSSSSLERSVFRVSDLLWSTHPFTAKSQYYGTYGIMVLLW